MTNLFDISFIHTPGTIIQSFHFWGPSTSGDDSMVCISISYQKRKNPVGRRKSDRDVGWGFNWFHLILFVTVRHLLLARKRVHISCTIHITPWPIPQLIRHAVDRWFVSLRGNRPEWLNWGFAEWKWINGTLQCNILRWHDKEEFVVFMGLLCQHFRVLVPLMSAPLEQSINPNTGAINVYSLLEFTASMVPISGLWPTESKAVNEWQFIESPSTGRSMPSAGTDEDSKATAKGNPEAIILIFRVKSTRI